ncbi:hypothetical protein B0T22DRAFT_469635 [Podospora appendiculata]|uniref:NmrA-like domain-containing protein n=1 Tax=Podospora appendiculata TaxID=314037 RepID=A0AAE0X3N5_9PEZI|nr:hypothetical protein B0T22DRAFT_469635 [Podospora appendiculata]
MVKIAVAGGSGNIAQEVIDAILATKKHQILILSRKDAVDGVSPGTTWIKVNYEDPDQLTEALQGVDTVLSFIVAHSDPGSVAQKKLIDASVKAGVRRFAPSEWASSTFEHMPFYAGKADVREYLEKLNKDKKVLEYSLFQPGLLINYLTYPYKSTNHIKPIATPFDFENRRALILEGSETSRITLTTAQDLANVVARAVDYEGEWPLVGGVKGGEVTLGGLIAIGEQIRGGPFKVERLNADDLKAGVIKASWKPPVVHPAFTPEQADTFASTITSGLLLGFAVEALNVSDEWNELLPDYKFTGIEEFLGEAWRNKP